MRGLADKVAIVTGGADGHRPGHHGTTVPGRRLGHLQRHQRRRRGHRAAVPGQGLPRAVRPRRHGRRGLLPPAGRGGARAMGQDQLPGQQRLLLHRQGARRHARGLAADDERRARSATPPWPKASSSRCGSRAAARSSISPASRPTSPSPTAGPTTRPRGRSTSSPAAWPWTWRPTTSA